MRLISWNVNGIRAAVKKGFVDWLKEESADVVCLQESRITAEQEPQELQETGYHRYWFAAVKKGYSGVGLLCKEKPLQVVEGLGKAEFDDEGRVITAEYPGFYLVNAYFPNSQHELKRLDYKLAFDEAFLAHCEQLRKKKPVVFCGDLNVAHCEIDLANPERNRMNPGFYIDEREWFSRVLEHGYLDTFRKFTAEGGHYSWWSYRFNARMKNIGWRIDYFVAAEELADKLTAAGILSDVYGSDHCPVFIELDI